MGGRLCDIPAFYGYSAGGRESLVGKSASIKTSDHLDLWETKGRGVEHGTRKAPRVKRKVPVP